MKELLDYITQQAVDHAKELGELQVELDYYRDRARELESMARAASRASTKVERFIPTKDKTTVDKLAELFETPGPAYLNYDKAEFVTEPEITKVEKPWRPTDTFGDEIEPVSIVAEFLDESDIPF